MVKVKYVEELEDGSIEKVESELNIKFPQDYIDFIKVNNGGYPKPNCFYIGDIQESINNFFSLNIDDKYGLIHTYRVVKKRLYDGIIPFGRDAGGNLICFDFRNIDKPKIVFCIHEMVVGTYEMMVKSVCSTFSEFIDMLCELEDEDDY